MDAVVISVITRNIWEESNDCHVTIITNHALSIVPALLHISDTPVNFAYFIFTHLKLCLADAIHNFEWIKMQHTVSLELSYIHDDRQYNFFDNNTPHGEQRWTVLIRQLLHTFQWQHATQWATLNCFNQTIVHCANSCKQSITLYQ